MYVCMNSIKRKFPSKLTHIYSRRETEMGREREKLEEWRNRLNAKYLLLWQLLFHVSSQYSKYYVRANSTKNFPLKMRTHTKGMRKHTHACIHQSKLYRNYHTNSLNEWLCTLFFKFYKLNVNEKKKSLTKNYLYESHSQFWNVVPKNGCTRV